MAARVARFRTARCARVLWALGMALFGASFLFRTWNTPGLVTSLGLTGRDLAIEIAWWSVIIPAAAPAYGVVGLLTATRKPHNPIGWLALGLSPLITVQDMAWQYAVRAGAVEPGQWPGEPIAAWLTGWLGLLMMPPFMFTLILLYFPEGRLLTLRWRWVVRLTLLSILLGTCVAILQPSLMSGGLAGESIWRRRATDALRVAEIGSQISALLAALSVILRYRRAVGHERQQVKWLAYITVIIGLSFVAGAIVWSFDGGYYLGSAILSIAIFGMAIGFPLTMGIAIFKHRLYEIDVIINRTLVYGALTAVLLATYITSVLALQSAFRHLTGEQSSLAVVTSTIAIVALFNPLRNRLQNLIDRRFYRSKYDAEQTLAAFSKRLRSEVDLDRLTAGLMSVVDEAVHPSHVSLWMVRRPAQQGPAQKERK